VEQINIKIIRTKPQELLIQILLKIGMSGDMEDWALSGQVNALPIAVFQRFASSHFTVFVDIGCV
jgi:hypothetical protein